MVIVIIHPDLNVFIIYLYFFKKHVFDNSHIILRLLKYNLGWRNTVL